MCLCKCVPVSFYLGLFGPWMGLHSAVLVCVCVYLIFGDVWPSWATVLLCHHQTSSFLKGLPPSLPPSLPFSLSPSLSLSLPPSHPFSLSLSLSPSLSSVLSL